MATRNPQETHASRQEEFSALVSRYLDSLYGAALRLTRRKPEAEDLVQETFLKAWRSFGTFDPDTNARAWLFKILMNSHIDRYRRAGREPDLVDTEDVGEFYLYSKVQESDSLKRAGDPEAVVLDGIMEAEVKAALESLPVYFRGPVLLADIEGFSYKEIAGILDIPVGTVMSRLYRGRRMLQRALWDYAKDRLHIKENGQGHAEDRAHVEEDGRE